MQIQKIVMIVGKEEQALIKLSNGMGGVTSEEGSEGWKK
jgi:hypothetical protein